MPDTGCGTPFRPVQAEFNYWKQFYFPTFILFGCIELTQINKFSRAHYETNYLRIAKISALQSALLFQCKIRDFLSILETGA